MTTFASVTEVPCTCNFLQEQAANPDSPFRFDARLNEFLIVTRKPDGTDNGNYSIYHCPFCGGTTPKSLRGTLFAFVTQDEDQRLRGLIKDAKTADDVIQILGAPDVDRPDGVGSMKPERDGQPPTRKSYRTLEYQRLSETADLTVIDYPNRRIGIMIQGKFIGPRD
jgi:hypothetical protein